MAPNNKSQAPTNGKDAETSAETPAWADGLRRLYDDVVEEPLPDAFKDLLAKLDDTDDSCGASS